MKHRLFKLVVFLLLGAVVNVAVAWGCGIWLPVGWDHHQVEFMTAAATPCWRVSWWDRSGARHVSAWAYFDEDRERFLNFTKLRVERVERIPRPWPQAIERAPTTGSARRLTQVAVAYGWPMVSLSCEYEAANWPAPALDRFRLATSGFVWKKNLDDPSVIINQYAAVPLAPLWIGTILEYDPLLSRCCLYRLDSAAAPAENCNSAPARVLRCRGR